MKNKFVLQSTPRYKEIEEELTIYLNNFIDEITTFLSIKEYEKPLIYLFDDKDKFKQISKTPYNVTLLGGCYNYFGVGAYIDLNKLEKEKLYICISHELTHWFYLRYVGEKGIQNRVIWFDEGLAAYLSHEHDDLKIESNLINYLIKNVYNEDKIIPNITCLTKHGNNYGEFVDGETHLYSGYVWSYLMIRYLIETLSKENLNKLMKNKKDIEFIGEFLPVLTYNYYKKLIDKKTKIKQKELIK